MSTIWRETRLFNQAVTSYWATRPPHIHCLVSCKQKNLLQICFHANRCPVSRHNTPDTVWEEGTQIVHRGVVPWHSCREDPGDLHPPPWLWWHQGTLEDSETETDRDRQRLDATRSVRRRDKLKKQRSHSWTLRLRSSSSWEGPAPFIHRLGVTVGSGDTPQPRPGEGTLSGGSCCAGPDYSRRRHHMEGCGSHRRSMKQTRLYSRGPVCLCSQQMPAYVVSVVSRCRHVYIYI